MFKSLQEKATKLAAQQLSGGKEKEKDKPTDGAPPPQPEQKTDYLDKGFAAAASKFGLKTDAKTNEQITDGARELFEKSTGKKVPEKFSN